MNINLVIDKIHMKWNNLLVVELFYPTKPWGVPRHTLHTPMHVSHYLLQLYLPKLYSWAQNSSYI